MLTKIFLGTICVNLPDSPALHAYCEPTKLSNAARLAVFNGSAMEIVDRVVCIAPDGVFQIAISPVKGDRFVLQKSPERLSQ